MRKHEQIAVGDKVLVAPFQGNGANEVAKQMAGKEGVVTSTGNDALHGIYYYVQLPGRVRPDSFYRQEIVKIVD